MTPQTQQAEPDLRRSVREQYPSWLISLGIHGLLLAILACIGWTVFNAPEPEVLIELGTTDEPLGGLEGSGDESEASSSSGAAQGETQPQDALAALAPIEALDPAALLPETVPATTPDAGNFAATDPALALLDGLTGSSNADGPDSEGRGDLLSGTSGGFQNVVGGMRRQGLDVVLVIDATNSMAPYIEQAKTRLKQIIGVITGLVGGDMPGPRGRRPRTNVRFGLVAYKDYGDDYGLDATESLSLTDDAEKVRAFIDRISAGGGGDEPEPIHRALKAAADAEMGWKRGRRSVIVLVGDAPVHTLSRKEAFDRAKNFSQKLRGTINVIDVGGTGRQDARTSVLDDLNRIATSGGGSAFLLKDEGRFWKHLIVSVFGQQFEQDVDTIVERYGEAED